MRKYRLMIAFDGTAYHGWQSQRSGMGVQDRVEVALAQLFSCRPVLTSSSRTDAGVHALGLIAHFEVPVAEMKMPDRQLLLALNALLPDDIRILSARRALPDFHARFDAKRKQYRYRIWNHAAANPLLRHHCWHVAKPLNLAAMQAAAGLLVGRHDFRSFTAKRAGELGDSHRTLTRCDVRKKGSEVTVIIEGEGFLYKMCRGIVGTLVQIGEGKFTADTVPEMLSQKDRRVAGVNAPAHGLVLWKVFY
jgi:tRNA pseudouridine38-40 synthase